MSTGKRLHTSTLELCSLRWEVKFGVAIGVGRKHKAVKGQNHHFDSTPSARYSFNMILS
jgi:hypothetical protein